MAKAKPTKGRKPAAKPTTAKHGPDVSEGVEATRELNESIEASGADMAPGGVVTWPTRYGNPDMTIAPGTPTKIDPATGLAVPVTNVEDAPEPTDEAP